VAINTAEGINVTVTATHIIGKVKKPRKARLAIDFTIQKFTIIGIRVFTHTRIRIIKNSGRKGTTIFFAITQVNAHIPQGSGKRQGTNTTSKDTNTIDTVSFIAPSVHSSFSIGHSFDEQGMKGHFTRDWKPDIEKGQGRSLF